MWKTPNYTQIFRPKLLLWLLVLLLLLLTTWQAWQVTKLGHVWQALPQRTLATPLVDYAEQEAVRVLLADDTAQAQRLVNELVAAELISSAQLYADDGHLLAASVAASVAQAVTEPATEEDTRAIIKANSKVEQTVEPNADVKEPSALASKHAALTYVRPLYQDEQPLGFLRLQLADNPLSLAQHGIWQQLEHHLSWLLPLCLSLGLLLGMGLQHLRQSRALGLFATEPTESTEK